MRIGIGKKQEQGLRFDVDIPGLAPFPSELVRAEQKHERSPAWNAHYRGERCGAFWKRLPKGGGEAFLSGHLESPSFPGGRLGLAIFVSKDGPGQMDMVWRPETEAQQTAAAQTGAPAASAPPADDDDEIPF